MFNHDINDAELIVIGEAEQPEMDITNNAENSQTGPWCTVFHCM